MSENVRGEITDLAWAAGFFDGEGCVSISLRKSGANAGKYAFSCSVSNTDIRPLLRLRAFFGGKVHSTHPATDRWNAASTWFVYQQEAAAFLRAVRPYLVIKGEQADVALDYIATMLPHGDRRARWAGMPPGVMESREELRIKLRALKGRKEAI